MPVWTELTTIRRQRIAGRRGILSQCVCVSFSAGQLNLHRPFHQLPHRDRVRRFKAVTRDRGSRALRVPSRRADGRVKDRDRLARDRFGRERIVGIEMVREVELTRIGKLRAD